MLVGWRRWRLVAVWPAPSSQRGTQLLRHLRYPSPFERDLVPAELALPSPLGRLPAPLGRLPSPSGGPLESAEVLLAGALGGVWWSQRADAVCGFSGSAPPSSARRAPGGRLPTLPGFVIPSPTPHPSSPAPDPDCVCGVYAARDPDHPELHTGFDVSSFPVTVLGQVTLGGTVLEHVRGFRASSATLLGPLFLMLPRYLDGSRWADLVVAALGGTYGVDVETVASDQLP